MRVTPRGWFAVGSMVLALVVLSGRPDAKEYGDPMLSRQFGNDLFATGGEVRLDDEIYGDAIAAGGSVTIEATVRGDALVAGGDVTLRGTTDEDVYATGGEVQVAGHIAGSVRIAGGEIDLDRDAVIDGAVSLAGRRVTVASRIGQYLQIAAGSVRVDGQVDGDVEVAAGELHVGPEARINGSLTFRGPHPPQVAEGAVVQGGVRYIEEKGDRSALRAFFGGFALLWLVGWLIVGCVALAIWPGFAASVTDTATRRFWLSLITGLAVLIGLPVASLMLVVSLIGIPLALLLLCAYLLILPLGYIASAVAIGDTVLQRMRRGAEIATRHRIFMLLGVLIGLYLITRVPYIGGLVACLVILVGVGSLAVAAAARYQSASGATAAPAR